MRSRRRHAVDAALDVVGGRGRVAASRRVRVERAEVVGERVEPVAVAVDELAVDGAARRAAGG